MMSSGQEEAAVASSGQEEAEVLDPWTALKLAGLDKHINERSIKIYTRHKRLFQNIYGISNYVLVSIFSDLFLI